MWFYTNYDKPVNIKRGGHRPNRCLFWEPSDGFKKLESRLEKYLYRPTRRFCEKKEKKFFKDLLNDPHNLSFFRTEFFLKKLITLSSDFRHSSRGVHIVWCTNEHTSIYYLYSEFLQLFALATVRFSRQIFEQFFSECIDRCWRHPFERDVEDRTVCSQQWPKWSNIRGPWQVQC